MHLLIHDLEEEKFKTLTFKDEVTVLHADGKYAPCKGCFKCWLKNKGYCVFSDSLQHVASMVGNADKITVISEITYGGFSTPIKNIYDRALAITLPFFKINKGEVHHCLRYKKKQIFDAYFYGQCSDLEKETAKFYIERIRVGDDIPDGNLVFIDDLNELGRECSF